MSSQVHRSAARIEPLPDGLESAQAKLVYLSLEVTGGASVEDLSQTLAMKKIDILSVLNSLSNAGYVERRETDYVVPN